MDKIKLSQVLTSETFYRYPKLFNPYRVKDDKGRLIKITSTYNKMLSESKIAYMFLKNRMELSIQNNFVDKDGFVYVIATLEELKETLGCGNDKVMKIKKELRAYGLIEEVQQGLNKPNRIYVGNLDEKEMETSVVERNSENRISKKSPIDKGTPKIGFPELRKSDTSNTYLSKTNKKHDTCRYNNLDNFPLDFRKGFNPSFLTDQTVQYLSYFGKDAQKYADIIFKQKRAAEFDSKELIGEKVGIVGDYVSENIEDEIQKFVFQLKKSKNKEKPINNPKAYFNKMMHAFWIKTLYQQIFIFRNK